MVQPHAVLEVSDGVLDLGVAPMVGLQFQGFPLPVGDEAVIAVGGEEGQLGTGRGFATDSTSPPTRARPGPRVLLAVSYPASSLTTAIAGRYQHPQ